MDKLFRNGVWGILIVSFLVIAYSVSGYIDGISGQAENTGPSANYQWQGAMSWVRNNTDAGDVFVHWWDYGYWVQYLGERPTVTDGGHFIGYWDHLIGRYLLTTPNPDSAMSFMKTHNVSYLLIDPTDLGKYPAYSKIGSDEATEDRFASIPVMKKDPSQTRETSEGISIVYNGGAYVDEDIEYTLDGKKIFLPKNRAVLGGVILGIGSADSGKPTIKQPTAVYFYNGQRYDLPLRKVYLDGKILDFGTGVDGILQIIPSFEGNGIDNVGAAIYLSPLVSKSLFAQLYLLNDVSKNYPTVLLSHVEYDIVTQSLKAQAGFEGEFIYYQGFRGPIKIWKVGYPSWIRSNEEFMERDGKYAGLDNLKFTN